MHIYKNDIYMNRGFTWQRSTDDFFPESEPPLSNSKQPADCEKQEETKNYSYPKPCQSCQNPHHCKDPCHCPCMEPEKYKYPVPGPIPYPYFLPMPIYCQDQNRSPCPPYPLHIPEFCGEQKPEPCKCPPCPLPMPEFCKEQNQPSCQPLAFPNCEAFGYFAAISSGGAFEGGDILYTFLGPLNKNVNLKTPNGSHIRIDVAGLYRITYSVTATSAESGVVLRLAKNNNVVGDSSIPVDYGLNMKEMFLKLSPNDELKLELSGSVALDSGINASILIQLVTMS